MVRQYQRKTQRQFWNEVSMKEALSAVDNGLSLRYASKTFNVPLATLQRRHKNKNIYAKGSTKVLGQFKTVFHPNIEADLVNYIFKMEAIMFGLTTFDVRSLAFQIAERNGLPNSFNKITKMAGLDWIYGFRKRHPEIALRQPEATSAARARAFNQQNVHNFFDLLEQLVDKHLFHPSNIYNVDETGMTTVQTKPSRILAKKGRRQVGSLTSSERGELVTVEICMNATGSFIPPLFIFPRVRMKPELMDGAPPGSIVACHKSGWMQTSIFTEWFSYFVKMSGASKDNRVLLILDGHSTHTKNIEVIDLARENGVELLCLPPHCSHKLQPLDVSFMKPLSTFYDQEVEKWLRNNPGRVVTIYQVAEIFGNAFTRAATVDTAANGFRKTGIFPTNRDIFKPEEFAPAETTDFPAPSLNPTFSAPSDEPYPDIAAPMNETLESSSVLTVHKSPDPSYNSTSVSDDVSISASGSLSAPMLQSVLARPCTTSATPSSSFYSPDIVTSSHSLNKAKDCDLPTLLPGSSFAGTSVGSTSINTENFISPFTFSPPPKASVRPNRSTKRGKATILTSSPYKDSLLELGKRDSTQKQDKGKRPRKGGLKAKSTSKFGDPHVESGSDAQCIYCSEWWSASIIDDMIQCTVCMEWSHTACAGISRDDVEFICDLCT